MGKIDLDRLAKKYGFARGNITGQNYRTLVRDILADNDQKVSQSLAQLSNDHWDKATERVRRRRRFVLPDVSEVVPLRNASVAKAAERGTLMFDSLRDRLTTNLNEAMREFRTAVTDEPAFIRRAGTQAGTVNPKMIDLFQQKIKTTFENYVKADPAFGVPGNIKTIAVTEVRSAVRSIKTGYMNELLSRNRNIKAQKRWRQNKGLAKEPRRGHADVNGQTIGYHESFQVPLYDSAGRMIGMTLMDGPHDPSAPAAQTIGCNCDIEYFLEIA